MHVGDVSINSSRLPYLYSNLTTNPKCFLLYQYRLDDNLSSFLLSRRCDATCMVYLYDFTSIYCLPLMVPQFHRITQGKPLGKTNFCSPGTGCLERKYQQSWYTWGSYSYTGIRGYQQLYLPWAVYENPVKTIWNIKFEFFILEDSQSKSYKWISIHWYPLNFGCCPMKLLWKFIRDWNYIILSFHV